MPPGGEIGLMTHPRRTRRAGNPARLATVEAEWVREEPAMGLYSRYILPTVISCGCQAPPITEHRRKLVPRAEGVVLELGMGSGLNLPLYDPRKVVKVYGLEPDSAMRNKACVRAARAPVRVRVLRETAEEVSLPDQSVDTVVVTFAMCTIPDVPAALAGARRVLRPGGRLLFCEHGRAPDPEVFRRQQRFEPLWMRLFGGCHLTRDIPGLLRGAGFAIEDLEAGYMRRAPRIGGYVYRGAARTAPAGGGRRGAFVRTPEGIG